MTDTVLVERRIVTVLFADLVGFTTLSERLDPEDVATIQDAYFSAVRETVTRYGGALEKFIGDAAMAVFGAPRARDDDAERAVRAGLALVSAVDQMGARLGLDPGSLQLRVGINSGEVAHATGGPDAGRVSGDTVNTAARLQAATRPDSVLVGELTALAVGETIELAEPESVELRGRAGAIHAREALLVRAHPSRDEALGGLHAPLLGRASELERLEAALDGNSGDRLTIVAPPGVGKSRLVAELAVRAERRGIRVLRARARAHAAGPYEAVAQLLLAAGAEHDLAESLADAGLSPARRAVVAAEVNAVLEPSAAASTGAVKDLAAERDVRFKAWTDALAALTAGAPAVWIVEDVHWAGADLLAFLQHASTHVARERRFIVATARPSLLDGAPGWVGGAEILELGTLPALDAAALVRALVGNAIPAALEAAIAERSDGNPLFIEELLRTWISVGTLARTGGAWRLAVDPGEVELPATVHAIYAAQLDDLPSDARLVARRASVAGRRFADAALRPLELDDRRDGLDVLRRRAFVVGPLRDPLAGDVYAYRHALLRDAGYASLARAERARLHAALARWLDETAGPRADEVAQLVAEHYAAALESLPAIPAPDDGLRRDRLAAAAASSFERAAGTALAAAAHEGAVRLLHRSIEHTAADAVIDLARRRLRLGEILADTAELDVGIAEMTAALGILAGELPGATSLYAEAVHRLADAYMQQIRFSEAEELTAGAVTRLAENDDPAAFARLTAMHAWSVIAQGRHEGVAEEILHAREIAHRLEDPALEIDVLQYYATVHDEMDERTDDAWAELERLAIEHGRWRQAAIASRVRGTLLADYQPAEALAVLAASSELAHAHGLTEQQGWSDLARCETLWVLGEWDEALAAGERALSLGERYAYERLGYRTWVVLLPLLAARRDPSWLPRHERWWQSVLAHVPATPSPYATTLGAAMSLWIPLARGEDLASLPPPPVEIVDQLLAFANPHFLAAIETIAESWLAAGLIEPVAQVAERLRSAAEEPEATPLVRTTSALLDAWLARSAGDADTQRSAAERAVAHAGSIGAAWWEARARRTLGEEPADLEARLGVG